MIRWVFFDVDQTLCDFGTVRRRALAETLAVLRHRFDTPAVRTLTVNDLQTARNAVATARPTATMEAIRRASLAHVLRSAAPQASVDDVDALTEQYLDRRFADPIVYPDVAPALERLGEQFELGIVSNGNSYPDRLGLGDHFSLVVLAQDVGLRKPDPSLFELVADHVDSAGHDLVMVGDSLDHDVRPARAAGWGAVWLQRSELAQAPKGILVAPDLTQLAALLGATANEP